MNRKTTIAAAVAALALIVAAVAQTASGIVFGCIWNPNPETDLAGYRLWRSDTGSNGVYVLHAAVSATTTNYTFARSNWGAWFRLTAHNVWSLESDPSNAIRCPDKPGQVQNAQAIKL
jgi:hypothetical protein